jgi:tellurite resistance protein
VIEIAVAVAMSDGNLADIEGITINKWMKKKLDQDVNNEKVKKLFNDTLKETHLLAESGQLNLREICSKLNSKGTKELQLEAINLAYEVMGADGHIHEQETEMIQSLASFLNISSTELEEIRDQFMIKTSIIKDFNILNLLGLPISASKKSKCNELKKEYKKWNGRLNSLSSPTEKKNAQKVLDLLGIARKLIDC